MSWLIILFCASLFSVQFLQNVNQTEVSACLDIRFEFKIHYIGLKPSELAYIAEKIALCDHSIVGKIFGFKDLSQYQEVKGAKCFNAMLLEWDRINQSQIEIRQTLSRKLLELEESYNGPLEQKPDFETLAKEIDIHGMLCIMFKVLSYVSLIYSTT